MSKNVGEALEIYDDDNDPSTGLTPEQHRAEHEADDIRHAHDR